MEEGEAKTPSIAKWVSVLKKKNIEYENTKYLTEWGSVEKLRTKTEYYHSLSIFRGPLHYLMSISIMHYVHIHYCAHSLLLQQIQRHLDPFMYNMAYQRLIIRFTNWSHMGRGAWDQFENLIINL